MSKEKTMSQSQTSANLTHPSLKKAYHAPTLNTLGTIEQLTQAGTSTGVESLGNLSGAG